MQEFIEYIVQNIVKNPSDVNIQCIEGQRGTIIEIRVAKEDIGKVVGHQGRTIQALRRISMMVGARLGKHIRLEIIE